MNGQFSYRTSHTTCTPHMKPYYCSILRYGTLIHFEDYKDSISNKYKKWMVSSYAGHPILHAHLIWNHITAAFLRYGTLINLEGYKDLISNKYKKWMVSSYIGHPILHAHLIWNHITAAFSRNGTLFDLEGYKDTISNKYTKMNGQFYMGRPILYAHLIWNHITAAFLRYGTLIHLEGYKDTISNKYKKWLVRSHAGHPILFAYGMQQQDRELFRSWMDREVRAGGFHQPQPCPPTCRCRRWDRRTTRRRFSTSLRRPRRHVGGPRWAGQCASFPCCPGRRSWRRSSCQFRTSWSTTTWSEPSSSGSAGTPSNIASAYDRWSWGKTAGPSWWLTSSGTHAADGCWPAKATSTRSSTAWCWNSSLRGCPRRPRSGSSANAGRRWTWPSNSRRTRWRRATGLANPYLPSLSLLLLPFLPRLFSLGPGPACYPGPSPDGEEDRHRSRRPWEPTPGRQGQPAQAPRFFPFLRGLHANSLAHFPPLGWRGSLGRPVGVAGTRATSSIGVQWWRWGHWSGFRTPHRLPPIKLAGTNTCEY